MRVVMFRKLEVDGVNYYQLFNQIDDFNPKEHEDEVTDFYHRGEKTYFYIDADSDIEIPDPSLLNIYYDSNEGFTDLLDSELFLKVFNQFVEEYHILIKEIKPIDEVVKNVSKQIMFQEDVIAQIVRRIYMNQSFVISDLPIELKECQKSNILFHGNSGSGKKSIIKGIQKELNIPYADITINGNIRATLEDIIKQLLERSNDPEEASCGIVYIRDNFEELATTLGNETSVYEVLKCLTSQDVITYDGKKIDFRTITFVILYDDDKHYESFVDMEYQANCHCELTTRELTDKEKYQVLFSENGCITHYTKFLNHYGNKFIVDEKCLMALIRKCSELDPSMDGVNKLINAIVACCTYNGINDVIIDKRYMKEFIALINQQLGKTQKKEKSLKEIEKYLFEKEVDQLFNEAKKYYIGQDKALKIFITEILNNLAMAEDKGLYSPQNYKLNILIRGGTGSGKSFLVNTVCGLLKEKDVAYTTVDMTKISETGYIGSSVEDMLIKLYNAAGNNLEKAQKGIIFLDEIDKKTDAGGERNGPTRQAVLYELLKVAEGSTIRLNVGSPNFPEYVVFDTSRVTFVVGGAFEGLEKIRDTRIGKGGLGFGSNEKEIDPNDLSILGNKKMDPNIINEDYIKYGMPRQFMRRVEEYINLTDPTKESILEVLNKSDLSALKVISHRLSARGLNIEYTDDFCEELAKLAVARKEGVDGARNALIEILQRINIQDVRASEVEKIILNANVISNPNNVILVPREKEIEKQKKKKI